MDSISKEHFLKMLKYRPQSLIGRQITYTTKGGNKVPVKIYDVSLCGDSILLDMSAAGKDWYSSDSVDNTVIIDSRPDDTYHSWDISKCTASSVMFWKDFEEPEKLKKLVAENKTLKDQLTHIYEKTQQAKTDTATPSAMQEWDDLKRTCVVGLDMAEPGIKARNTGVVMVLKAVQNYLLTLPQGAHKEILYQIDDALKLLKD